MRLKYVVATIILVSIGRFFTSAADSSWTWKDWLALFLAFLGATQLVSVFAPKRYLELMRQPRSTWAKEDQTYADSYSDRRLWLLLLSFGLCYCAVFLSYGSISAR